jgi:hypothetical protein
MGPESERSGPNGGTVRSKNPGTPPPSRGERKPEETPQPGNTRSPVEKTKVTVPDEPPVTGSDDGAGKGDSIEEIPPVSLKQVENNWDDIITKVKHKKITIGSFLQEGRILDVKKNDVEIGFGRTNNFHVESIMRNKDLVLEAVRDVLGEHVTFHCVQKNFPESESMEDSKKKRLELLKELKDTKPAIQKIVDDFDVEIVD